MSYELVRVARIETDFPAKFGVPRQSGLVRGLRGRIVFERDFRDPEALRGLEGFSHIWLLWDFSEARKDASLLIPEGGEEECLSASFGGVRPTVRPPRLGGNRRMGVWATRSPYRPNNIGLSSVRIVDIQLHTPDGPVIEVEGADLMDGTPIFDIKPYLPFTDSHPDAAGGFADETACVRLSVNDFGDDLMSAFDEVHIEALREILRSDPRPRYHDDSCRTYAMAFAGREVKFRVEGGHVRAWLG